MALVNALLVDLGPGSTFAAVPVQEPQVPPGQGPEFGKASPVALVVVLLLFVATMLLIRSMTKRIKRLPASFEPEPRRAAPADEERPAG